MAHKQSRAALTVLELTVVIAIVGVLLAIALPAVQRARSAAARSECANHLRQIGLALHQYQASHNVIPPGMSFRGGKDPFLYMSWHTRLLPYVDEAALWNQAVHAYARFRSPFWHAPPHPLNSLVRVYTCPVESRIHAPGPQKVALTSYLGVQGLDQIRKDGMLFVDSQVRFADVSDGLSSTLFVGERPPSGSGRLGYWYAGWGNNKDGTADMVLGVRALNVGIYGDLCPTGPYEFGGGRAAEDCDAFHFWSLHHGGAHFLFGDGAVRFLNYSSKSVLSALATRAGGEAAPAID